MSAPHPTNIFLKEDIINALTNTFQNHIGIQNAISSGDLFQSVTGIHVDDIDYYERAYKWNFIKRVLAALRKDGKLFVVMGPTYHYVLDSEEELEYYKSRVDATIKGLYIMKGKASSWINSRELKELKIKAKEAQKKKERKVLKVVVSQKAHGKN